MSRMTPFSVEIENMGVSLSERDYTKFDSLFKYMMPYFAPGPNTTNSAGKALHEAQGVATIALIFIKVEKGGKPTENDEWDAAIKAMKLAYSVEKEGKEKVYYTVLRGLYQPYFLTMIKKYKIDSFDRFKRIFSKNVQLMKAVRDLEQEFP